MRGKAEPIRLTKLERRTLENYRFKLEEISDQHAAYLKRVYVDRGKKLPYSDRHYMPIIKLNAILLAADGKNNKEIADILEISQHTAGRWRNEFLYILSRDDLPFDRIKDYFLYSSQHWLTRYSIVTNHS